MRSIKFRAWDGEKMIQPPNTYSSQLGPNFFTLDGRCYIHGVYQDLELMQYTGLKDKNGTEIYEDDILAFEEREWYRCSNEEHKGDYLFLVTQAETGEWVGAGICTEWSTYCEVVGNIYENSNLL